MATHSHTSSGASISGTLAPMLRVILFGFVLDDVLTVGVIGLFFCVEIEGFGSVFLIGRVGLLGGAGASSCCRGIGRPVS